MPDDGVDAIVIGSGPNGLVAANLIADAGWSVRVLEAADTAGGAVRTEELTLPGFRHDTFSCFYPLAQLSPALRSLHLEQHGLRWLRSTIDLAHVGAETPVAVVHKSAEQTANDFDHLALGDGAAWLEILSKWQHHRGAIAAGLFEPFPPVRPLLATFGTHPGRLPEFIRFAALSVRRFGDEQFIGPAPRSLFLGNALHADLSPEGAGSAAFGALLTMLAQDVGFPVARGGAASLVDALVSRLRDRGGELVVGARVARVRVERGRAVGAMTVDGHVHHARRAVIADTDAVVLANTLLADEPSAEPFRRRLRNFQRDYATVKIDWAIATGVPWADDRVALAATVHVGTDATSLSVQAAELAGGRIPGDPFVIVGQPSVCDSQRAPTGMQTIWAYTHVPLTPSSSGVSGVVGRWDGDELRRMADHLEAMIERLAPGFRSRILARHVLGPIEMAARNANLVEGGLGGGTNNLHQQLIFRPGTGWGRGDTSIRSLFLGSASAHPGGGVHGGPGANAALAALKTDHRDGMRAYRTTRCSVRTSY